MIMSVPCHLDSLVPTDPFEDDEIEISFDSDVYSIMVSQHNRVQSVVDVPRSNVTFGRSVRRLLHLSSSSSSRKTNTVSSDRKADMMRPLSPMKRRGSVSHDKKDQLVEGRQTSLERASRMSRRRERSCPPLRQREPDEASEEHNIRSRKRDYSLPPALTRQRTPTVANNSGSNKHLLPSVRSSSRRRGKKPNLVTSTVSRNGKILKTIQATRTSSSSSRRKQFSTRNLF